jgi:Protein kinase domain
MSGQDLMPKRLGAYRLLDRIGEGGMGVVFLARGPGQRTVALKVLRSTVASEPTARRRLAREVETMRRVRSPFVAEVIDADLAGHMPYVVTRYVPGRTLEEVVNSDGPLRGLALARLACGLADALVAVHAAGVVHRDLKPSNVMLVRGAPVIIDFGIAQGPEATRLTLTGMFMGTPGYLAPEVIEGQPSSEASDVHAWGATVAFAATGRPPFGTGPFEGIFYRIVNGRPDLEGAPAAMLPLLAAVLARDPAQRPSAFKLSAQAALMDPEELVPGQLPVIAQISVNGAGAIGATRADSAPASSALADSALADSALADSALADSALAAQEAGASGAGLTAAGMAGAPVGVRTDSPGAPDGLIGGVPAIDGAAVLAAGAGGAGLAGAGGAGLAGAGGAGLAGAGGAGLAGAGGAGLAGAGGAARAAAGVGGVVGGNGGDAGGAAAEGLAAGGPGAPDGLIGGVLGAAGGLAGGAPSDAGVQGLAGSPAAALGEAGVGALAPGALKAVPGTGFGAPGGVGNQDGGRAGGPPVSGSFASQTRPLVAARPLPDDLADVLPPVRYAPYSPPPQELGPARAPFAPIAVGPSARRTGPRWHPLLAIAAMVIAASFSVILPVAGTLTALTLIVVLRAAGLLQRRSATRRLVQGAKASDPFLVAAAFPWFLVRASLTMVLLAPFALATAAIAAGVAVVVAPVDWPSRSLAYAAGALVAFYGLGPGSGMSRRQLSKGFAAVARTPTAQVVALIGMTALTAAVLTAAASGPSLYWPSLNPGGFLHVGAIHFGPLHRPDGLRQPGLTQRLTELRHLLLRRYLR